MTKINQPFTMGIWKARAGREEEFISAWSEFAKWTSENIRHSGTGYLLQHSEDSHLFYSFGGWDSEYTIREWRNSDEFKKFVERIKILCEDFKPNSLKLVAFAGN